MNSTAAGTRLVALNKSAARAARRTLYIFVEVGARELLSRLVLAEEARRRGYRVLLGEKNLLRNLCWMFRAPPGIILDKCGQICRTRPIRGLKRRGFRYVVLDEEGIFFSHAKRAPRPDDVLLFNNEYQRRLSDRQASSEDVVGNPGCIPARCCHTSTARWAGSGHVRRVRADLFVVRPQSQELVRLSR